MDLSNDLDAALDAGLYLTKAIHAAMRADHHVLVQLVLVLEAERAKLREWITGAELAQALGEGQE